MKIFKPNQSQHQSSSEHNQHTYRYCTTPKIPHSSSCAPPRPIIPPISRKKNRQQALNASPKENQARCEGQDVVSRQVYRKFNEEHINQLLKQKGGNGEQDSEEGGLRDNLRRSSKILYIRSHPKRGIQDASRSQLFSANKLYQIPINRNQIKQKLQRQMGLMKVTEQQSNFSVSFNSYYEFQQHLAKLTTLTNIGHATHTKGLTAVKDIEYEKKVSLVPALRPTVFRQQRMRNIYENEYESVNDYMFPRKRRQKNQTLIVQSKRQQLILNISNRYSDKNKKRENIGKQEKEKMRDIKKSMIGKQKQKSLSQKAQWSLRVCFDKSPSPKGAAKSQKNLSFFLSTSIEGTTVYEQKMRSYRQFLFIVNFAHRIYDPLTILDPLLLTKPERHEIASYSFYVGPGNNSNLIRGLMQRRFWWTETSNPLKANFAWTQIKLPKYFLLQGKAKNTPFFDKQEKIKTPEAKRISVGVLRGVAYRPPFTGEGEERLLTGVDLKYYLKMLQEVDSGNFQRMEGRLRFLPKEFLIPRCQDREDLRVHNHFEGNSLLGNKKALFYQIRLFYRALGRENKAFPRTFHIRSEGDSQFQEFIQELNKQKGMWILKPGENSNRGSGIIVFRDLKDLLKALRLRQKHSNGEQKTFIIQKYIQKPLLYKGRKFDIRHYLMVSRLHGRLRAYWHAQGYVRTSSYLFSLDGADPLVHLTNDAIQKYAGDYGRHQEANKISYNQLQKYFQKNHPEKRFDLSLIFLRMRQLGRDAINSAYLGLDPRVLEHNFQVYGLDFMLDQDLNVYLIEVNTNPCLQLSGNVLSRVIPSMLQQSLRLTIDPLFPPPAHYSNQTKYLAPDCSLSKLQWELIFDEGRDGKALTQLYSGFKGQYEAILSLLSSDGQQQGETYDNDGEKIQIQKIILN